jgi:hypothetical protein
VRPRARPYRPGARSPRHRSRSGKSAGRWRSATVVCIASGPSLHVDDLALIEAWRDAEPEARKVIAVNNAGLAPFAPWADVLYAGDGRWWREYWTPRAPAPELWTVSDADDLPAGMHWIRGIDTEPGISPGADRIYTGGNSGYAALGLAALWGASKIILTGYDMQRSAARATHAHADHHVRLGNPTDETLAVWVDRFAVAARDLRQRGIDVVNCTRRSALSCFDTVQLDDAIERPPVYVQGMLGLGDNLYSRPFVRQLSRGHDVYLRTPWPQLYADLEHVTVARSRTALRTQAKNEHGFRDLYDKGDRAMLEVARQGRTAVRRISYAKALAAGRSMLDGLADTFECGSHGAMDLPPLPPSPVVSSKPICVVRPVTVRREWHNTARNPKPEYVRDVAAWLRAEGMHVVSVADLVPGEEDAASPLPEADQTFHRGELDAMQLLALVKSAAAIVGPVGWIVPAALAARVPLFVVQGGQGEHNAADRITDASMMLDLVGWGTPDDFCRCASPHHGCRKTNSHLREQFDAWRLRVAGARHVAMVA